MKALILLWILTGTIFSRGLKFGRTEQSEKQCLEIETYFEAHRYRKKGFFSENKYRTAIWDSQFVNGAYKSSTGLIVGTAFEYETLLKRFNIPEDNSELYFAIILSDHFKEEPFCIPLDQFTEDILNLISLGHLKKVDTFINSFLKNVDPIFGYNFVVKSLEMLLNWELNSFNTIYTEALGYQPTTDTLVKELIICLDTYVNVLNFKTFESRVRMLVRVINSTTDSSLLITKIFLVNQLKEIFSQKDSEELYWIVDRVFILNVVLYLNTWRVNFTNQAALDKVQNLKTYFASLLKKPEFVNYFTSEELAKRNNDKRRKNEINDKKIFAKQKQNKKADKH